MVKTYLHTKGCLEERRDCFFKFPLLSSILLIIVYGSYWMRGCLLLLNFIFQICLFFFYGGWMDGMDGGLVDTPHLVINC